MSEGKRVAVVTRSTPDGIRFLDDCADLIRSLYRWNENCSRAMPLHMRCWTGSIDVIPVDRLSAITGLRPQVTLYDDSP